MSNNNGHNEAREAIQAFVKRYASLYPNGDHIELIQLAAFPVAVTVHLLYQIWANFGTFTRNGTPLKIDALAVNDCIQSNLFRQTGPDLFEMDADVRQCLLEDLRTNRGKQFVKDELAAFLYQYSRQNTQGSAWRNYYDAQQWAAIMEVDEKAAAEQILSSLAQELQKKNTSRGLGIVNLIAALEKDNKQFSNLLQKTLNKPEILETEPSGVTSKRIVLTDEVVDGRTPVKINLPPSLSNRLKKIVQTNPTISPDESTKKQVTVYGLFVPFAKDTQQTTNKIADLLIEKQYITRENVTILPRSEEAQGELLDIRDQIASILSKATEDDIIILYFNCGNHAYTSMIGKITPEVLNGLISEYFLGDSPDIILFIEAASIGGDWFELTDPAFTMISTGNAVSDRNKKGVLENLLSSADNDTTYVQLYDDLLLGFTRVRHAVDIFQIPHLITGKPDTDQLLFSKKQYQPLEEIQKKLKDIGRDLKSENDLMELSVLLGEGIKIQGREKTISTSQVFFRYKQKEEINCLWLLQKEYKYNMEALVGISSETTLWGDFFDLDGNETEQDIVKIVRKLFETHILFIGLTQETLSGSDFIRVKTLLNICKARRILLYFIIEEDCSWSILKIRETDILLPQMILSDYLEKEGIKAFTKLAFREITEMIGEKNLEEADKQGTAYGIFVGVSEYTAQHLNLHEPVNDTRKISEALLKAQLLEENNISLLLNNNATLTNVISLLKATLRDARKEDTVLFYFSGHATNQQHNSALLFYDSDTTSEYTSVLQNGVLTDVVFNDIIKAAPNDPTIILILDTHAGSRQWLDENNPRHFFIMATHLEETCYELIGFGGILTKGLVDCLNKQPNINYIDLYQSVFNSCLAFAHERGKWQTPLFIVHKDHWVDMFLSRSPGTPIEAPRVPKSYEDLRTKETLHCIYYSDTVKGAATFYHQLKFALYEKRIDVEYLNSWVEIDKSFSVRNRFPDIILIGLKVSTHSYKPRYNIEKLLTISEVMQIPVYFILEDDSKPDPSIYKSYPFLPADKKPVFSGEDVVRLIAEIEAIAAPLVSYLKPIEEDYETIAISLGITHYEHLPSVAAGTINARRFDDWVSGPLKNKVLRENCYTFITGSGIPVNKSDIEETVHRIAKKGLKRKQVMYIYVSGYSPRSSDFLLCLPSWNEKNTFQTVVNIDEYIEVFSRMGFEKIIVLTEYMPVDVTVIAQRSIKFEGTIATTSPSCFFKVKLRDEVDSSYSPILDGLYGEAAENDNIITTKSLMNYLNRRSAEDDITQRPQISIKDTPHTDFIIATLDPSFKQPRNTYNFKQRWVLIVGSSKSRLSQPEWLVSNALARELARSGYGIITGGWRGVDAVVAEAYANQLADDKVIDEGYLIQVVLEKQELEYPGGLIERVANETQSYERVFAKAYAVIMIGGIGGTYDAYRKAEEANVLVLPVAATGGDAARAHEEIKDRRLLPAYLLDDLLKPIRSVEDAARTADAICNFLDGGFDKQYHTPNQA